MSYGTFYSPSLSKATSMSKPHLPSDHPAIDLRSYSGKGCPFSYREETAKGGEHEFQPPKESDVRSVCPALNAMANHGYLPRDGRNLSFKTIYTALKRCYGLSTPLAIVLTTGGFLLIGRSPVGLPFGLHNVRNPDGSKSKSGVINLKLVGLHGGVEHDASLVHEDCATDKRYPSIQIREDWVEDIIGDIQPHVPGYSKLLQSTSSTTPEASPRTHSASLSPPDTLSSSTGSDPASTLYAEDHDVSSHDHSRCSTAASDSTAVDAPHWKKYTTKEYLDTLVSCADVGRMRARREKEIKPKKLDGVHAEIARGEMAIILGVWERETYIENDKEDADLLVGDILKTKVTQTKKGIPLPFLLNWLGEERLPEGWGPSHTQTLLGVVKNSKAIKKAAEAVSA